MADELFIGKTRLEIRQGDIVQAGTEALVNAANSALAGGGGVDGAIHRAAGRELYDLTKPFGGCATGSAVLTGAGRIPLPTRFIIHAVGPIFNPSREDECRQLLASAYRTGLELASQNGVKSLAFPSLSTGAYGYPISKAAPVAVQTVIDYLKTKSPGIELVVFMLFSARDFEVYRKVFERAGVN
jgi:serine/threonine-protein kinase